jgi:hypothetical protein
MPEGTCSLGGADRESVILKLFVEGQCCDAKFHHPVSLMLVFISSKFIRFIEGVSILFSMIDRKDVVLFKILIMETTSTIRQVVDDHGGSMISQYK